jgi:chromosome segregation ATPase
VAQL